MVAFDWRNRKSYNQECDKLPQEVVVLHGEVLGGRFIWGPTNIEQGQLDLNILKDAFHRLESWRKVNVQCKLKGTFSNDFLGASGLSKGINKTKMLVIKKMTCLLGHE